MNKLQQVLGLAFFLIVVLAAAGLGAWFTTPEIEGWYRMLKKPAWNPPDAIFGPVWTMLYLMMGVSGWLIWKLAGLRSAIAPLLIFAIQLILNVAWSWIFFGLHQPGWAVVDIVFLWLAIVCTIVAFFQRSKLAAWLLVPYFLWVSFASILNFTIWRLNIQ